MSLEGVVEVVPILRDKAHDLAYPTRNEPVSVMLDLVDPPFSRRSLQCPGGRADTDATWRTLRKQGFRESGPNFIWGCRTEDHSSWWIDRRAFVLYLFSRTGGHDAANGTPQNLAIPRGRLTPPLLSA